MKQTFVEDLHLRDYLTVLLKRKWTIVVFFAIVVLVVTIASLTASPIYRATATIMVEKDKSNPLDARGMYYMDYSSYQFLNTQFRLIQSHKVAAKASDKLNEERGIEPEPARVSRFPP